MFLSIVPKNTFETHIRLDKYTGILDCFKGFFIWHLSVFYQIRYYYGGTSADPRRTDHQYTFMTLNGRMHKLMCLLEMIIYLVVRHIVYVKYLKSYAVFIVGYDILIYSIDSQHVLNIQLKELL